MDIEEMRAELEDPKSPLCAITLNGVPIYDMAHVYKIELEETPTEEKYNELFMQINDWETSVDSKNSARSQLIEYWNELDGK